MSNFVDPNEWKQPDIADLHLKTNEAELIRDPPPHWQSFRTCMEFIEHPSQYTFYDLGCATGVAVHLLETWGYGSMPYVGIDFSEAMIERAKGKWTTGTFFVEDFLESDRDYSNGIVFCSGVIGLLPDPDAVMRKVLSFRAPYVLLLRERVKETATNENVASYSGLVRYHQHTFAKQDLHALFKEFGYNLVYTEKITYDGLSAYVLKKTW